MKKKSPNDPILKLRRIVRHNNSLYVCLPKPFVQKHGLKAGEKIPIICDHIMKVVPMKEEG